MGKEICNLFLGGHCPICDDEWCDLGISYEEAQQINKECCENSYHPDKDEIEQFLSEKAGV